MYFFLFFIFIFFIFFRRPLMPTERDGVVLQLGSHANFSKDLLLLDRETSPLRVRPSCPRNFKRTSVERYFREKGFAIDWCAFRLLILDEEISTEDTTAIYKVFKLQKQKIISSFTSILILAERGHFKRSL